jgi:hypothetical protein
MKKLIGNVRIRPTPASDTTGAHFAIDFQPYHGKLNTQIVRVTTHDELVEFLIGIKISEDEAARWAGRARASVVLIPSIERTEELLRDKGLLAT